MDEILISCKDGVCASEVEGKSSIEGITPDYITQLSPNEIFVFGSNLEGRHYGGAAAIAAKFFGAEMGKGVGIQGQSYAIPTMQGGVETIKPYVDDFIQYAKVHPDKQFLVTRIGCGIAGFKDEEIAPLFSSCADMKNVSLPKGWREMGQHLVIEKTI